jgi:hypothetical protein
MTMEIIKGKQTMPKRVVIYAPEGIGKSTLASQAPNPVFADIEGGTNSLDVARLPKPSSWAMFKGQLGKLKADCLGFQTLVVDTADWAERLCLRHICDAAEKESIEDFGYGKGFVKAEEEWGRFLDFLTDLSTAQGMNIIVLAHAHLRKFEQPDESGAYDRYEMKLSKKLAPMTKEWADTVLFINYETFVVEDDKTKSKKAQGGKRVIHTVHHPAWDAKNRDDLPEKLQFPKVGAWKQFPSDFFFTGGKVAAPAKAAAPAAKVSKPAPAEDSHPDLEPVKPAPKKALKEDPTAFPAALWDLMEADGVTDEEIRKAVAHRGYYPLETQIGVYDQKFVDGVLVAAWPKVKDLVTKIRNGEIS